MADVSNIKATLRILTKGNQHLHLQRILHYLSLFIIRTIFRFFCLLFHVTLAVKFWGKGKKVPPVDNKLLLKSATQLAKEIREGKLKSEDVIQAYIKRIIRVDSYLNATVDRCFHQALEEAKNADSLVASKKYTKQQLAEEKPLLGVPFTVKLILKVKDLRCTGGSVYCTDHVATEDSSCVALMKKAGAIVIATTNMPEAALHMETCNKVHGVTNNPYDTSRTSGGSSGGEGSLISAGGSVIGLGNDLAGSIRIPSHFCGIFGHKPTASYVPNGACCPPTDYLDDYVSTGPLCRYAEDMETVMKILTSEHKYPLQFGSPVKYEKLKIYYMMELDNPTTFPVDDEIQQGLRKAVAHFQKTYGAYTKEVNMTLLNDASKCFTHNLMTKVDKIENLKAALSDGKAKNVSIPLDLLKYFLGKSTFSQGVLVMLTLKELPFVYKKADIPYYQNMVENLLKEFNDMLDDNSVFMFPTFPITAPYHNEMLSLILSNGYTSIFNVLGFPSTHCPIGFSKEGLPYGIQVIGRKTNDPLTIACAKELEKAFGGWIPPQNTWRKDIYDNCTR